MNGSGDITRANEEISRAKSKREISFLLKTVNNNFYHGLEDSYDITKLFPASLQLTPNDRTRLQDSVNYPSVSWMLNNKEILESLRSLDANLLLEIIGVYKESKGSFPNNVDLFPGPSELEHKVYYAQQVRA